MTPAPNDAGPVTWPRELIGIDPDRLDGDLPM